MRVVFDGVLQTTDMGLNEDHRPSPVEESVIEAFKAEHQNSGQRRMTPKLIRERHATLDSDADLSKQNINNALNKLTAAGWVTRVTDGLYEFVDDPRDDIVRQADLSNYAVAVKAPAGVGERDSATYQTYNEQGMENEGKARERAQARFANRLDVDRGLIEVVASKEIDGHMEQHELNQWLAEVQNTAE
jgi:hypothetical protein